jgi:hypothetical protein
VLTDPSYQGDLLFVSAPAMAGETPTTIPWRWQQSLSADDTRELPYRVERFDANNLVVHVSNTLATPVWLFYSDVWHPWWRATINESPAPVYRANVAYKAVRIQPGENVVHLRFHSEVLAALMALGAVNAGFWLITVGTMLVGAATSSFRTTDVS